MLKHSDGLILAGDIGLAEHHGPNETDATVFFGMFKRERISPPAAARWMLPEPMGSSASN
jgi:hypothetical protein